MRRTPIAAGNWKMNLLRDEALALARALRDVAGDVTDAETVVCPPFLYLHDIRTLVDGSSIRVGAQDVYWEEKGAFTGEVSVTQVAEAAEYVIIGHSERRQYFGETDETVNRKVKAALGHGLKPIMCVGELLEQRQRGETEAVLVGQVRGGLAGVTVTPDVVIAYEPVWAIGTGLAADARTAQETIRLLRDTVRGIAGDVAGETRVLYRGSVTADNIAEF
ncbi:MAG TPA: triose-phosphate isomerase, partial [Dehalococcoidia bacterium]|nr:triose-phosphate isomerase [Dehalococcoidia bacterium]